MPKGLRYKIAIAFFLTSLIPLFVCICFILAYLYPEMRYPFIIGSAATLIVVLIAIVIAILGFVLLKQIVDPVVHIARQAKQVADGKIDTTFEIMREDEIGDLGESLNRMTSRIKEAINELHSYGEKTKEINIEIHRKVLTLSNLLQIGNLISAGTSLEEVAKTVVEKLGQLEIFSASFVYFLESEGVLIRRYVYSLDPELLPLRISFGNGIIGKVASQGEPFVADSHSSVSVGIKELKFTLRQKSLAIFPITVRGTVAGILGTGNSLESFKYSPEDLEAIKIFAKQLSIAVENDLLSKRAKELEMKDELTQLYNERFTRERLDEEIKRAIHYQRPCSLILVDVDQFQAVDTSFQTDLLKQIAKEMGNHLTEADRAARWDKDLFAMIIPERNKREATQLAETFRRRIEEVYGGGRGFHGKKVTVSAGVSENPIDGSTAEELIRKAKDALTNAKSLGKNRVVA